MRDRRSPLSIRVDVRRYAAFRALPDQKYPKPARAVPIGEHLSRRCPMHGAIYASASMAAIKARTSSAASSTSATGNCISPANAR